MTDINQNSSNSSENIPSNIQQPVDAQNNPYLQPMQFQSFERPKSKYMVNLLENCPFVLTATVIYALLYTFCLYSNACGVTAIFYGLGTLTYYYIVLKKLEVQIKKAAIFYGLGILALSVNLFTTTDPLIICLDHIGLMLLLAAGLIHMFYDDSKWGMGKYLSAIFINFICGIGHGFVSAFDLLDFIKENGGEKGKKGSTTILYVLLGVVCAVPLLAIVLGLLSSADQFFGDFVGNIIEGIFTGTFFDHIAQIFMFLAAFIITYGLVRVLSDQMISTEVSEGFRANAIIAITINVMVSIVYLIFSGFQIFYLFLGNMTLPEEYSYAEYAREGFFQLVVVCLINMVMVLVALYFFKESKVLTATLLVISGCTYIMIASSTLRMIMYVSAYQLSYTRVFVFVALMVIFMEMNGIVIFIFNKKFPLFRYAMIVVAIFYIAFAYSKPTVIIARNNLSQKFCNGSEENKYKDIDFDYITDNLSLDAAPAIAEAIEREHNPEFTEELANYWKYNDGEYSYRQFNIAKMQFNNYSKKYCN